MRNSMRLWNRVWADFGYDAAVGNSAYEICDDDTSADYIFGWYWYFNQGESGLSMLLASTNRNIHAREMGFRDAEFSKDNYKDYIN